MYGFKNPKMCCNYRNTLKMLCSFSELPQLPGDTVSCCGKTHRVRSSIRSAKPALFCPMRVVSSCLLIALQPLTTLHNKRLNIMWSLGENCRGYSFFAFSHHFLVYCDDITILEKHLRAVDRLRYTPMPILQLILFISSIICY